MQLSRELTSKIQFILDECLPPVLRDASWFMKPLLKLFYKQRYVHYLDFKERAPLMTEQDMAKFYADVADAPPVRETDLAAASIEAIVKALLGREVLEAGAGKCHLAKIMAAEHSVTAADIYFDPKLAAMAPNIRFVEAPVEKLPFPDHAFETVVCANTLEHVLNIQQALRELRRVTRRRLIIAMPKQRPYRYTFDAHLRFFPYRYSVLLEFAPPKNRRVRCEEVGGGWIYVEDIE